MVKFSLFIHNLIKVKKAVRREVWRRAEDSNPWGLRPTDFKSAAIDHSASPPLTDSIIHGFGDLRLPS